MIRVTFSDGEVVEYPSTKLAKFSIINILFATRGSIVPIHATEIFGLTTGGVSVERPLKIRLGVVEFE